MQISTVKFTKYFAIIAMFFLVSCDLFESDFEHFAKTYRQVLLNRELNSDSIKTYRKMLEILDENGYDIDSFREEYMKLSKKNPQEFLDLLDSLRSEVAKETIDKEKGK